MDAPIETGQTAFGDRGCRSGGSFGEDGDGQANQFQIFGAVQFGERGQYPDHLSGICRCDSPLQQRWCCAGIQR